jgi:hypothetical protein
VRRCRLCLRRARRSGVSAERRILRFSDGGFLPKAATAEISFNVRPHPGLLPREEGAAFARFLIRG